MKRQGLTATERDVLAVAALHPISWLSVGAIGLSLSHRVGELQAACEALASPNVDLLQQRHNHFNITRHGLLFIERAGGAGIVLFNGGNGITPRKHTAA